MQAFIYGGSGSGKSHYAEHILLQLAPEQNKYYIATMQPFDDEARRRIASHQASRAHKGFVTIEQYTGLKSIALAAPCSVLLECVGNLVANEIFSPDGAGENEASSAVLQAIEALSRQTQHLVIVSNDVISDGVHYTLQTEHYRHTLAQVNNALAAHSETVVEMVCGLPIYHKGAQRWEL